jgi:Fanconi-associated nuclease 1
MIRYVRLFLRKTSAWHRVAGLGYHSDIANIEQTIAELQESRPIPDAEPDIPGAPGLALSFAFAENSDIITTVNEASSLLKLDELKALAKDARIQGRNKRELLDSLRRTSKQQLGLSIRRTKTESQSGDDSDQRSESEPDQDRESYYVSKIMSEVGPCVRLAAGPLKLFERVHLVFYRSSEWTEKSLMTIILARMSKRNFPEYIVSRSASVFANRGMLVEFEDSIKLQYIVDEILENGKPSEAGLQKVTIIFEEVHPRWQELVLQEQEREKQDHGEGAYLRRLSPAWVYTRIIHKAAGVLGKRKMYKLEHETLKELLAQRLFHHARRGGWYQRKALLEELYLPTILDSAGRPPDAQKRHWKRIALQTCEEGLEDPLTHLIYHRDLQKRTARLERACRIPKREQRDFSHVQLTAPVDVYVEGVQIQQDPAPGSKQGAKTTWLDPLEGDGACSVEAMCLSDYRRRGWKGYHSEGGVVRTLFALCFLDVLFLYVPNVFQTPFQTCPLDLHTDAFYAARSSEINARLARLENGGAPALVEAVWDTHAERRTCVAGLDWAFEREDVLEIAQLFPGRALAAVCKVLAQEYGARGAGLPDLFLWHPERGEVMFSEVKSPNDRLSDAQRLWIDVLTGAGLRVELCHAVPKKAGPS